MIAYGTKIKSDIKFPLDLSHGTQTHYEVELSSNIPLTLKQSITCGFPLYFSHGRKVYLYSDRLFDGSEAEQPWCFEVKDVVTFYWLGGKQKIYYKLHQEGDTNLLSFWFIHILLPTYMALENMYDFFHAGAVEVDGKPIFFMAPSMGGKSTMTDYFIKQGHLLISDDKVPTFIKDDKFMAVGSHPYHRPYRKLEDLGYRVDNFTKYFKPIHAFYLMQRVKDDANITIKEINGFAKFDLLWFNHLYMYPWLKTKRLKYLSSMLNSVRVFKVAVPWDKNRLREVHNEICEHSRSQI